MARKIVIQCSEGYKIGYNIRTDTLKVLGACKDEPRGNCLECELLSRYIED